MSAVGGLWLGQETGHNGDRPQRSKIGMHRPAALLPKRIHQKSCCAVAILWMAVTEWPDIAGWWNRNTL